MVVSETVA